LNEVRTQFIDHILKKEPTLIDAIAKQVRILNGRKIVAIFITEDFYRELLNKFMFPPEAIEGVVGTIKATGEPVGFWSGVPVYVSMLMEKAPIFVVGEIKWELKHALNKD